MPLTSSQHPLNMPAYPFPGAGFFMSDVGKVEYDRKSKAWYVVLHKTHSTTGQRERIYYIPVIGGQLMPCKSKDDAEYLRKIINQQITQGIFRPERFKKKRPMHFEAYAREWIKGQTQLMASTRDSYEGYIDNHLIPHLKQYFIEDINEGTLDALIKKDLVALHPKTKVNIVSCLMKILRDAKRARHIPTVPEKPQMTASNKVIDPAIVWLEPETQSKILDSMHERHRPIYMFMMLSGCRPSEARALQWSDVLFERKEILIQWTLDIKGKMVPVKGKKILPIPMSEALEYLLENHTKTLSPYVFQNPLTGNPYRRDAIDKIWRLACKKALKVNVMLYHATRHSYASQMVNAGVQLAIVQRLMRHTDMKTTRRYYELKTNPLRIEVEKVRSIYDIRDRARNTPEKPEEAKK